MTKGSSGFWPFPSTHWSEVAEAGRKGCESQREALGRLILRYRPALKAHLLYGMRLPRDRAEDLLQSFLLEKVVERDLVAGAKREKGRFRGFLRTALHNHVVGQMRRDKARKMCPAVDGKEDQGQICAEGRSSDEFDVAWGRELLAEALKRMQSHCRESGRPDIWGVFECRVLHPTLDGAEPLPYARLVERFQFRSPQQASNTLITAKRMFVRSLRSVIAEYAEDEAEVDAEILDLKTVFSSSGAGSEPSLRTE